MSRLYLILGPSGRGKSTSLENLDKKTTVIINVERKALPFKGAKNYRMILPTTVKQVEDALSAIKTNPNGVSTIVIDSFSAYSDIVNAEANIVYSGYDIYKAYNNKLFTFFKTIKDINEKGVDVVLIGHDETLMGEGGTSISKRLKVAGKQWEGLVEKEFDTVLWADCIIEADKSVYEFVTQTNGMHPAKSAKGMLPLRMANDMAQVLKLAHEYDDENAASVIVETLKL